MEVQNQLQPLLFDNKEFKKIIFYSVKHPKMSLVGERGGGGLSGKENVHM